MKSNCTVVLGIDATSAMRRNQPKNQYVNDWSPSNDASAAVNLRVEDGVYYSAQISGTRKYECQSSTRCGARDKKNGYIYRCIDDNERRFHMNKTQYCG